MDGEWSSLNGICSDEADFMAQLLGNCSLPNDVVNNNTNFLVSPTVWPAHESSDNVSQASSGYSILFPFSSQESYYSTLSPHVSLTNNLMSVDGLVGGDDFLNQDVSNDSLESNNDVMSEDVNEGKKMEFMIPPQIPREEKITKKRSRAPCEAPRNKKMKCDENKSSNVVFHRQSSSSCCSEDESNASHEMNGTTSCSSSKGKTRASRGSATDPQSLYARKRRERINERLKILQTLVPNGTKVDISTMLEEAVEYVKFLQLQIKLLSSDDMWMYAPIAYNGMNIGLDVDVSTLKPQS